MSTCTDDRCPEHGQCVWVDCDIPGWHEHRVGSEWWIDEDGNTTTAEVTVRGLVVVSRNALAELLKKAGYTQIEEPRRVCDPLPPGEEPPASCTGERDCPAVVVHMLCCQSIGLRPPPPIDRPLLPDPVVPDRRRPE